MDSANDSAALVPAAGGPAHVLEGRRSEIFSAIIAHHALPSTLQRIADAFLAQYPSKAIAILLCSGGTWRIEAEAGLPDSSLRVVQPFGTASGEAVSRTSPHFEDLLQAGFQLCLQAPLVSDSGETRGLVAVFEPFAAFEPLDELLERPAKESLQNLCDLARLAVEHDRLYHEVVHRSQYDPLTGLPNRLLLEDRLRQAMVIARRQGTLVAVCCVDIDRFQQINDGLGHELGDAAFKAISARLLGAIREIDTLARHGGDEFILTLRDLAATSDAESICGRLLNELSAPFQVEGHRLTITASAGISIFPDHGDTADSLLRNADMALQAAKQAGRGRAQIYTPALGRQGRRAAEMVAALVAAVAQEQLRIAYQPIFNMKKEIVGMEALLRWKHNPWGQISPLEFIPVAEKTGLIVPIGDWVIEEVCRQAKEWDAANLPPIKFFANISGVQLERADFTSKIAKTLERTGFSPNRLELEITESWVISDLKGAAAKLQELRDLGIGIAIDDFGTGYSTFNYLQELPLDTLKIDRSFISRLTESSANLSTVRAITGLARQLGLKTVAEGVESEEHLAQLNEIGCDLVQGFLLARPLKPHAASSLLRKQQPAELPACL
jgi:diguanylate cyclase (GGDEF)-like protein